VAHTPLQAGPAFRPDPADIACLDTTQWSASAILQVSARSTFIYRVGQKKRGHRLMTTFLSNFNRFNFFTRRFLGKFALKRILKIPPHLATLHMLLHYLVKD